MKKEKMPTSVFKKHLSMDCEAYGCKNYFSLYFKGKITRMVLRYRLLKYYQNRFKILYVVYRFLFHRSCLLLGCDIPSHTSIGGGFVINHPRGTIINSNVVIGNNCTIVGAAVIGKTEKGTPIIGDNCFIGAHALLIGNIVVGNNVEIGAGAIVTCDVPDNAVMVCEKAHVLKIKGS